MQFVDVLVAGLSFIIILSDYYRFSREDNMVYQMLIHLDRPHRGHGRSQTWGEGTGVILFEKSELN